jgi:beta-glucosidase
MAEATHTFPRDFLWGTATASHQVEGGNTNNDWHTWEQSGGGKVYEDQVSGEACNWWGGLAEKDVRRMKELGTNSHRLSIEWSRIEPKPGKWDNAAIDRYRAILSAMQQAKIKPMVTLHHFTNPIWLAQKGGWLNPEITTLFRRFVQKVVGEMNDLCSLWCTINEPGVYAAQGYFQGTWPPGVKDINQYFQVVYNMAEAHAAAYSVIHDLQPQAQVGIAHHMVYWQPRNTVNPLNRLITNLLERMFNGLFLDTLKTGLWRPLVGRKATISHVRNTLDWIGLNYYQRYDAAFDLTKLKELGISYSARSGMPKGPKDWGELYPEGLFHLINQVHRQFRLPIYITENGTPDENDNVRPGFLIQHLRQVWRAIQWNIPVMGYYFWSLLDNFEWAEGYDTRFRFGLYGVDFRNQRRSLRKSGELYKEICKSYSLSSDMARRYAPELLPTMFPGEAPGQPVV